MSPFNRFKVVLVLIISCAASIAMLYLRFHISSSIVYVLLLWNLFLATTPLIISNIMIALNRWLPKILILAFAFLWLLFFPNAPYICTDLIHLKSRQNIPLWFDALLLFVFAWNGLFLGFVSLLDIHYILFIRFGKIFAWVFVVFSIVAGSFGVYLGRFLRWNSWDIITNPIGLLNDVSDRLLHPQTHLVTFGVTLFFSIFLLLSYLMIRQISKSFSNNKINL